MKRNAFTAVLLALFAAGCSCGNDEANGPEITASGPGVVSGLVTDSRYGSRIANAKVTAGSGQQVTTNEKGEFTLEGLPEGSAAISIAADDYAPGFGNAVASEEAPGTLLVTLKKEGPRQSFNPGQETVLSTVTEAGPYAVFFQPNTLDSSSSSLSISITPVDPTIEADVLPGELVTQDAVLVPLTFAEFSIFEGNGRRVNLKAGTEAVVELPVPPSLRGLPQYALGQTIHCYSYNPTTGAWEDFVVGTVVVSSVDQATPVVRASIKHFSWYGAAPETDDCVDVYVKILGPEGQPLKNARVEAFPGSVAYTEADGFARLITPQSGVSRYVATRTFIDTSGSVSGIPGAKVIEIGRVEEELPGLVRRSCRGGSPNNSGLQAQAGERGTAENPLEIRLNPAGALSYRVSATVIAGAEVSQGIVSASLNEALPEGESGEGVAGAILTLAGNGSVLPLTESGPGSYFAVGSITPGVRYTLTIDADHNGTIDGSGSVVAVGQPAFVGLASGATVPAADFVAQWSTPGASQGVLSYFVISQQAGTDLTNYSYYIGTAQQYRPSQFSLLTGQPSGTPLAPGVYTAQIMSFSGPYGLGQPIELTPNITGTIVGGELYSYGAASVVEVTLQ